MSISSSSAPERSTVAGTIESLGIRVGITASPSVASPMSTSYVVTRRSERAMPSPVDAFPCGSISITSVGSPTAAKAVPRLIAVVVLPTPPFWLATTRILGLALASFMKGKLVNLQNHAHGVAQARVALCVHPPRIACLGQFGHHILSLEEETNGFWTDESLCIARQTR